MNLETAIELIANQELEIRREAIVTVEQAGKNAVSQLLHTLESDVEMAREVAVSLLCTVQQQGDLDHPNVITALTRLIKTETNPACLQDAIGLLADIYRETKDDTVFQELLKMLTCDLERVPEFAAESLAELGDLRAVEPLIELLHVNNLAVVVSAIEALGRLKDNRANQHIIPFLKTGLNVHSGNGIWIRDSLAQIAANSLKSIGDPDVLEVVRKWECEQGGLDDNTP